MLSKTETQFLASQGLSKADVYDGRNQSSAHCKDAAKQAGARVVLGAPCKAAGHRLRTRAGHCVQCDTRKLAYQERHRAAGYVYIAGSKKAPLLKIGTAVDIDQRQRNLRNQRYGEISDWTVIFYALVENGGEIEGRALRALARHKVTLAYNKDGKSQDAAEVLNVSFPHALKAVSDAIGDAGSTDLWMARDHANHGQR